MKREFQQKLVGWRDSSRRKPLLITGVRQCGKTHTLKDKQFCKKYKPHRGYKLSLKNLAVNDLEGTETISLPLYLTWQI